jgi:hypothetical protein
VGQPIEDGEPAKRSEHTCPWLYKNMTMDANGRIFPCCGAPEPSGNLIFSNFDGNSAGESFNSERYRLARQSFADRKTYRQERAAGSLDPEPYCVNCEWDQEKAAIDSTQVAQYLQAAGTALFNGKSVAMLS